MNDKPKFTPGPYEVYEPLDTFGYDIIRPAGDTEMGNRLMARRVSRISDAHLIAAAPALYEALEAWASGFDGFSPSELHKRYAPAEIARIEMTIVALRAARGEP